MNYNEIVKMTPAYDTIKNKERQARQLVEKWDRTRL